MSRRAYVWDGNPETAPLFWQTEVRRVLDVNGTELVVVIDQDGEEYVVEAWRFDGEI